MKRASILMTILLALSFTLHPSPSSASDKALSAKVKSAESALFSAEGLASGEYRRNLEEALALYRQALDENPEDMRANSGLRKTLAFLSLWAESRAEKKELRGESAKLAFFPYNRPQPDKAVKTAVKPDNFLDTEARQFRMEKINKDLIEEEDPVRRRAMRMTINSDYRRAVEESLTVEAQNKVETRPTDLVLEWNALLLQCAQQETDPQIKTEIVTESLEVIEKSLALSENDFGLAINTIFVSAWLSQNSDRALSQKILDMVDKAFAQRIKEAEDPSQQSDLWLSWGRFLYETAFTNSEGADYQDLLAQAQEKMEKYVALANDKNRARMRWGLELAFIFPKADLIPDGQERQKFNPALAESEKAALAMSIGIIEGLLTEKAEEMKSGFYRLLSHSALKLAFLEEDDQAFENAFQKALDMQQQAVERTEPERKISIVSSWGVQLKGVYERLEREGRLSAGPRLDRLMKELAQVYGHPWRYERIKTLDSVFFQGQRAQFGFSIYEKSPDKYKPEILDWMESDLLQIKAHGPQRLDIDFALAWVGAIRVRNERRVLTGSQAGRLPAVSQGALRELLGQSEQALDKLSESGPGSAALYYSSGSLYPVSLEKLKPRNQVINPYRQMNEFSTPVQTQSYQEFQAEEILYRLAGLDDLLTGPELESALFLTIPASLYRRAATLSYVPPVDQAVYYGRALDLYTQVETSARKKLESFQADSEKQTDWLKDQLAVALNEKALIMAESSRLKQIDKAELLLSQAKKLWGEAEKLAPGSSNYARARWAATEGDLDKCRLLLKHKPVHEARAWFPQFETGRNDPAFIKVKEEYWFKRAWFDY